MAKKPNKKIKKSLFVERLSDVDPAGLAPAWLRAKGNMLLYASRAQIHDFSIDEKSPFCKGPFS
ncbi:MAG: hypothetical protein AUJ25_03650 [Parcubacteria group bacterium CG1_02_37_13]|nr:MAG: hypothetical protein AUJ25_03650 [Parcubacteria group bacterium CG1_02_37_13]